MIDLSKNFFFVEDENGNTQKHDILFSFHSENNGNTYIVHTANEKDGNGNVMTYVSYINTEKHGNKLMNIEDDDTFNTIKKLLAELMEKARVTKDEGYIS